MGWSFIIFAAFFIAYIGLFSVCDGCMGKDHTSNVIKDISLYE